MDSQDKQGVDSLWQNRFFKFGAILLALILGSVILMACKFFSQAVLIIIFTAACTFILSKPVNYFERKGINRATGTLLAFAIAIVLLVLFVLLLIPPVIDQVIRLIQEMPQYVKEFETNILPKIPFLQEQLTEENIAAAVSAAEKWLGENGGSLASGAFGALSAAAGGVGYAFGVVFVGFILTMTILTDLPQLSKEFMSIFNEGNQKTLRMLGKALGDSFYGWLKMMVICGFVFGLVTALILDLIGVPYAYIIGVFCFAAYFIPMVGPIVAAVVAGLAGLCNIWWIGLLAFAITFAVATIIQSTLQPNLTQNYININPGFALFAGTIGGIIWGPIGLLIGVPIYAALQAIMIEYYAEYKGKQLAGPETKLFMVVQKKESKFKRFFNMGKKADEAAKAEEVQADEAPAADSAESMES